MRTQQWAFCIVSGLTVMTVVGCYSHYPASVYGPGGPPGAYQVQPGGVYPQGGSYVLPAAPLQGSGASLGPGATFQSQSPTASDSTNRWQSSGGDAPAYDSSPGGATHDHGDNPVPDYRDPVDSTGNGFDEPDDFGDTNRFESDAPPTRGREPMSPFDSEDDNSSPFDESAASSGDDLPYVSVESELTPVTVVSAATDSAPAANRPSPYKYDRKEFRWLRGVVDYDSEAGTWNIIYDVEPDAEDEYGGSISLSGVDRSEPLKNGDICLAEGEVDLKRLDAFGKPMFRVDRLTPLEPAN